MTTYKILSPLIVALFLIQSSHALDLQSYNFANSYRYSILEDSLKEKFPGTYVFGASYGYVNSPFYYSDTYLHERRAEIIDSNNVFTAGFTYYLNRNASLEIHSSIVHNNVFNESHTTLGDTQILSRINIMRTSTASLSVNPQVIIPTGATENFTTTDSMAAGLNLVAEKSYSRFHLLASVGAHFSKNNVYQDVDHRQLLLAQLGVSYDVNDKININLESYRNIPLVDDVLQDEGKYFLTAKHKTHKNFSTYYGAGVAALDEVQRNTYSFLIGIKIHEAGATPAAAQRQEVSTSLAANQKAAISSDRRIYFPHDQYKLPEEEMGKMKTILQSLKESEGSLPNIIIEGYASSIGEADYNMKLSKKRAKSVKEYLVKNGIPENKLSIRGFGETAPQHQIESKNRKVQFNLANMVGSL
jgi:outer membrane protein OmpA-like peptidoglycan-associated protein